VEVAAVEEVELMGPVMVVVLIGHLLVLKLIRS
jgi:hypothetical protein